jgi:hypothetical protein
MNGAHEEEGDCELRIYLRIWGSKMNVAHEEEGGIADFGLRIYLAISDLRVRRWCEPRGSEDPKPEIPK